MTVMIGIIGGTGLDDPDILEGKEARFVETPYGKPSDALIFGKIKGIPCVLLARHGRKHNVAPSHINYRANIWALKEAGCTHVISTSACGSLQEDIKPGDVVFLDQFIDRTYKREQTFYDGAASSPLGICHMPMAEPFCMHTRQILMDSTRDLGIRYHQSGTVITVEGPRFSSKAESRLWRMWGATVINMTSVPEVVLAKEAGLCYATIALATDYDCWREDGAAEGHVSVSNVMQTLIGNSSKAVKIILHAIPKIAAKDWYQIIQGYENEATANVMQH